MTVLSATAQSFLEGSKSFFSVCIWPLLPGFVALVVGRSCLEPADSKHRSLWSSAVGYAAAFVVGFILLFMHLGYPDHGLMHQHISTTIRGIGGFLTIALGAIWLIQRTDLSATSQGILLRRVGFVLVLFFGAASAAAWIPCIGPTLSEIVQIATAQATQGLGLLLLMSYGTGLGAILMILAGCLAGIRMLIGRPDALTAVRRCCGLILVLVGFLIWEGHLNLILRWMPGLQGIFNAG